MGFTFHFIDKGSLTQILNMMKEAVTMIIAPKCEWLKIVLVQVCEMFAKTAIWVLCTEKSAWIFIQGKY